MKRIMGVDYGSARIGVALSDELQMLAHPAETIVVAKTREPAARIAELARQNNVARIVVGLPRHMDGSVGVSAQEATDFSEKIKALASCEVRTWDERLSTVAAHRALREAGKSTLQTRGYVDQVAAQMLLQGYLDSLEHNQSGALPDSFA